MSKRIRLAIVVLVSSVISAVGVTVAYAVNEWGPYMDAARADYPFVLRGTVIRFEPGTVLSTGAFTDGGPYVHANSAHRSVGVKAVKVDSAGQLVVNTDGGSPIVSTFASADETLTERGIWCGASGGSGTTNYRCYKAGKGRLYLNRQADWDLISGQYANIWLGWIASAA